MPDFSILSNSAPAAAGLSGGNGLALVKTRRPFVGICNLTPHQTVGSEKCWSEQLGVAATEPILELGLWEVENVKTSAGVVLDISGVTSSVSALTSHLLRTLTKPRVAEEIYTKYWGHDLDQEKRSLERGSPDCQWQPLFAI